MCRECAAATARERAASELLAKCRSVSPLSDALKAAFPIQGTPYSLAALAAQIERSMVP